MINRIVLTDSSAAGTRAGSELEAGLRELYLTLPSSECLRFSWDGEVRESEILGLPACMVAGELSARPGGRNVPASMADGGVPRLPMVGRCVLRRDATRREVVPLGETGLC